MRPHAVGDATHGPLLLDQGPDNVHIVNARARAVCYERGHWSLPQCLKTSGTTTTNAIEDGCFNWSNLPCPM
eukprot:9418751-Lingulodinium_polyedra.AAC.1